MAVTAVQLQTVVDACAGCDRLLEREHEQPIWAQRFCQRRDDALQVAEIHERVRGHDQVEAFAVIAQVIRQLSFYQSVVDVLLLCVRQHPLGQIHADQPARKRRDERAAESRPASSTSRRCECSRQESSTIAATSVGARYDSLASFDSKLAAKLSNVVSTKPFDARSGTSRPVQAASMCRAIGSPGSSSSHSSKISTALSTSPSVQCASASSFRASRCFGLSVITLQ